MPPLYRAVAEAATEALPNPMSRTPIAALAALAFVFAYIVAVVILPEHLPPMWWPIEAVYWGVAGLIWVLPVRWLMLWSVGKR